MKLRDVFVGVMIGYALSFIAIRVGESAGERRAEDVEKRLNAVWPNWRNLSHAGVAVLVSFGERCSAETIERQAIVTCLRESAKAELNPTQLWPDPSKARTRLNELIEEAAHQSTQ